LDEKIDAEKGISVFGFGLEGLAEKEISRVEEKNLSSFLFDLGD
jgi:hypothetical protein